MIQPILIAGHWQEAKNPSGTFHSENPATGEQLPEEHPVSTRADWDRALTAAAEAAVTLRQMPAAQLARFLTLYADRIVARGNELIETAHLETSLPKTPRLKDIELPRAVAQLRQAAAAALDGTWSLPTIDTKPNIRSYLAPIGPVLIFGPNNFPFAFNAVSGGDFAAAIAAGNPVIAKAHPSHPGTTCILAEEALAALKESGLPAATLQLIYHTTPEVGLQIAADPRLAALAFTGSRQAGLKLKAAADAAGKPIYLEMSSINPVVLLPGALRERSAKIADEYADSALAASGQFCTNPGLVLLLAGPETDSFIAAIKLRFESRAPANLLSTVVLKSLTAGVQALLASGAQLVTGGATLPPPGCRYSNTLLRVDAATFLANPQKLQTEAFGNAVLFVIAQNADEARDVLSAFEGNLTGTIYSATAGEDDALYTPLAATLRPRVGRLLNDKMPTGVALSPAMNHGGPFPSTGHPGFTAVGIPASLRRFAMLQCFDNVRPNRLPSILQNKNPNPQAFRLIDGDWTHDDITT